MKGRQRKGEEKERRREVGGGRIKREGRRMRERMVDGK